MWIGEGSDDEKVERAHSSSFASSSRSVFRERFMGKRRIHKGESR